MVVSQNGFPANDRSLIRSSLVAGTDVKLAVRIGPAGDLLLYAAARWHHEVEPLRASDGVLDCWGYAERLVRGSATEVSNHASGTAVDLRARIHPLGKVGTYSAAQVAAIKRILADCRGAIRWGGQYSGRKDEMHLEIVVSESACALVLRQLASTPVSTAEEFLMSLTDSEQREILDGIRKLKPGLALPGRSKAWGDTVDDAFGWSINAAAAAADAANGVQAVLDRMAGAAVPGPAQLTDADVQRIAAAVVALTSQRLAS